MTKLLRGRALDVRCGDWLIVVALMMPKHVRRAVFEALMEIGEL